MNGEFKPGERLGEEIVAQYLSLSRNTARLILARLEDEELVESEPFKGKRVAKLSLPTVQKIMEAREVLEGALTRLAAERVTESNLLELQAILDGMEDANRRGDYNEYSRLNGKFHQTIFEVAGNDVMARILVDLKTRIVRYQYRTVLVPGRSDRSLAEHREIFRCLQEHNPASAEEAMRRHVHHVWETIRDHQQFLELGGGESDRTIL